MNSKLHQVLERGLVDTHLWVSSAAAGLTLFAATALGLSAGVAAAGVVFSATLLIYAVDDFFDGRMRAQPMRWYTLAFGFLSLGAQLLSAPTVVVIVVAIGSLPALLYGAPIRGRRLRELPAVKPFFVAAALTVAAIAVPVVWARPAPEFLPAASRIAMVAVFLFGLVLCNVCFFDLRDRVDDARAGIRTVPVMLGVAGTRRLCLTLCLGVALAATVAGGGLRVPLIVAAAVTTPGKPPALPGDSSSLTVAGIAKSLPPVNRSKFQKEGSDERRWKITALRMGVQVSSGVDSQGSA